MGDSTFTLDEKDEATDAAAPMSAEETASHRALVAKFKYSATFFAAQREREMQDLKFIDFDEQWEPGVKAQRAGNQVVSGAPPTPARPAITINQLKGPARQMAAQRTAARIALEFVPSGVDTSGETAEVFENIVRAIQHDSRANIARNWAADRAEKAGMGWYEIDTEYEHDDPDFSDPSAFDQRVVYRRVLNQASIYPDPQAEEPDFSDGRILFKTQDYPWDLYKERWPNSRLSGLSDSELTGIGDQFPELVFTAEGDTDGQTRTVRIAQCWQIIHDEIPFIEDATGRMVEADATDPRKAKEAGVTVKLDGKMRRIRRRRMEVSIINAVEYLEQPREVNGKFIPFVCVIGDESNVNGERRWTGFVRPGRESAVAYNVMRSAQIETIGLATKAPYIGYMETIAPYLEWWANSNTRNYMILPITAAHDEKGNLLPAPQRTVSEPAIQAITIAAGAAKEDVHTTTGFPPVALGQLDPHDRSGKAIQALQGAAEQGASGYLNNLVSISVPYEGKVLRDLIPDIFDRPGRIVPSRGLDDKTTLVMLNYPFFRDQKTKRPVPAVAEWRTGMPIPEGAEFIDLKAAKLNVTATLGKSYATRRQEAADAIGNVMKVVPPEMAAAMAPAWLSEQDFPGAKKIGEIAKNTLPPNIAKAYDDNAGDQNISPAAKQVIEQQGQVIEKLSAELQQRTQQIETDAVKEQAETERAAQADATRVKVAGIQAEATVAVAEIKAANEDLRNRLSVLEKLIGVRGQIAVSEIKHAHELGLTAMEHQHARETQAIDVGHDIATAASDREHDHRMADHTAALQPKDPQTKD